MSISVIYILILYFILPVSYNLSLAQDQIEGVQDTPSLQSMEQLKEKLYMLEGSYGQLQAQYSILQDEYNYSMTGQESQKDLERKVKDLQEERAQQDKNYSDLETRFQEVNTLKDKFEQKVEMQAKDLEEKIKDIDQLTTMNNGYKKFLDKAEIQQNELVNQIVALKLDHDRYIKQLETEKNELKDNESQLEKQIKTLEDQQRQN